MHCSVKQNEKMINMHLKNALTPLTLCFLLLELVLYILILTAGGDLLVISSYGAIVICFLYALANLDRGNRLLAAGLACTVAADFFLVVCSPIQQLWGMVFFLAAQTLYAVMLHRQHKSKPLLFLRILLSAVAITVTFAVLRDKTDILALISICYYANLIMNIAAAFSRFRENRLLAVGFVLFLLCDTVIGLQVASGGYLPIRENSLLYKILFVDFNLSWFFYLPSQVCIALSCKYAR